MKRYALFLIVVLVVLMTVTAATAAAQQPSPTATATQQARQASHPAQPEPGAPFLPDPFEPNNSLAAAAQIWLDANPASTFDYAYEEATIAPTGDADYFKIITSSGLMTYVQLAVPAPPVRLELAALDAAGNVLAEDTSCNPAADYVAFEQPMAAADFLYLRVRPCPGQGALTEVYGLYVEPGYDRYEVEPNDSRGMAQRLGDNPYYPYEPTGSISTATDRDFYQYSGMRGEALHIQVDNYAGGDPGSLQPRVAIMNADGKILTSGVGDPAWPYSVGLDVILPNDGDYFVRVIPEVGVGEYDLNLYAPYFPDSEPNNTPAQAITISYGAKVNAALTPAGDVDVYKFEGSASDWVMVVDAFSCYENEWDNFNSAVRGPGGALITTAQNVPFQLPSDGTYTVTVTSDEGLPAANYDMELVRRTGDEPNDTQATAVPIAYGQEIHGLQDPENDVDYYSFNGRLGDVIHATAGGYMSPWVGLSGQPGAQWGGLLVDAGTPDAAWTEAYYVLPADGVYYLGIDSMDHCGLDWGYGGGPYELTLERSGSLYVSSSVAGLGGVAAIAAADIAARNPLTGQWEIAFDGSDVGLGATQNVNAFEFLDDGSLLIALGKAQNLTGIAGKVKPWDVLRFVPTSLGGTTAGAWSMYLKGSTAGLTAAGEKIDAIQYNPFCWGDCVKGLTISLSGSGSVPGAGGGNIAVGDEDLISYWYENNGKWEMVFDGSAEWYGAYDPLGVAAEDVSAATYLRPSTDWETPDGQMLLGLDSAFNFAGVSGGPLDVVAWEYYYWGSVYGGDYFEIDWPGPWKALTNPMGKKIDGLSVGPAWK